jgi:hypothetical protein
MLESAADQIVCGSLRRVQPSERALQSPKLSGGVVPHGHDVCGAVLHDVRAQMFVVKPTPDSHDL